MMLLFHVQFPVGEFKVKLTRTPKTGKSGPYLDGGTCEILLTVEPRRAPALDRS